jgi:hypothetical protein
MTEQETQAPETETGDAENESQTQTKPTETVDFWKKKAREQETRAKANAAAATKLQEYEDRDKTEAQRLADRAEAAERRAIEMETQALRLEVAAEKGLTPAQAKRLMGSTREEFEADADELLTTFRSAAETKQEQAAASLDLGTRGGGVTPSADQAAANWLQSIARR